jgi:hypothetical protein
MIHVDLLHYKPAQGCGNPAYKTVCWSKKNACRTKKSSTCLHLMMHIFMIHGVDPLVEEAVNTETNMSMEPLYCFPQGCQGSLPKRLVPREEGGDLNYLDTPHFRTQIPLPPQSKRPTHPCIHQESPHELPHLFLCQACYPRYLGITRRSCLEAHMVLDMEYREHELLEHGPGGPIFLLLSQICPVSSTSFHHYRPRFASERTLAS